MSEWISLYGALIKLLVENGDSLHLPKGADPRELAFNLHESAKARSFIANLASTEIRRPASIPQQLREREERLLVLVRELQSEGPEQNERSQTFRFEWLQEINRELQACWEAMRPFAPEYVRLRSGEPSTLQDLKTLLSGQLATPVAFVSFFCDEGNTTCFVMRSDEKRLHVFHSTVGRKDLSKAAKLLRREFNGAAGEFPPYPPIRGDRPWERTLKAFEELSDALLNFLPAVQGVELLCIAPHGPLHLLPLHALRAPDGKFLVEHFAVAYCPSLSTLRYTLEKAPRDPLTVTKPAVYVAGIASRNDTHPEFFEHDDQIFNPQVWDITADMGVAAGTKSRVLQQLSNHDVVHLTCHGSFDDKDPLHSGLLLSSGQERPPRNPGAVSVAERSRYLLTARDFLRTSMHARIVTLRACSTGIQAERNNGDELEGLSRALLYAGNAAIVVSLWNVDQQSSRKFLTKLYQYWAESAKPIEKWRALWMVQRDFLKATDEPFLSHPYHWAPLILIGDWR